MRLNPNTPSPADPLGYDVYVRTDVDGAGRSATGLELVEHGMLHRLQEDTLLQTDAPNDEVEFGENLRLWVGEALTQDEIQRRSPRIEEVLRRDPRIATIAVSASITTGDDASRYRFTIRVFGQTTRGQAIDRIIGVSAITVEFLAQGR